MANDVRICVQHADGRCVAVDGIGLQKVHPVGPFVLAGFAGSVELGFAAITDLRRCIGSPPDGVAVSPCKLARWWWRRPRRVWRTTVPERLKPIGLEVMIVGVSPEPTPFPTSHGFIFRSPTFEPERIRPWKPASIGRGNLVPRLARELDEIVSPESLNQGLLRAEVGFPLGGAGLLGLALGAALQETDEASVSEHFQTWQVRLGEINTGTNDMQALTPGVPSRTMPPLATTWEEMQALAARFGFTAAEAVA